ncbi:MAG: hypothetical protein JWM02_1643 [Frankiales bacterium]|nr:hypothetical protein [Frankiales bacterium]
MTETWGFALLLATWLAGVILATNGRRHAARVFTADRPPGREMLLAQFAGTALNRVVPAGGGLVATHTRLLQRRGHDRKCIAAAIAGYATGGALAHLLLMGLAATAVLSGVVTLPSTPHLPPMNWPVLWTALLVGAALLAALRTRAARRLRSLRETLSLAARAVCARPRAVAGLTLLQFLTQVLTAVGLFAAVSATGTSVSFTTLLVVYVASNSLASAIPAPAGVGPVEVGLVGALVLLAVPLATAATSVALFRAVTYWLPVPLGIAAAVMTVRRHRRPAGFAGMSEA